MSSDNLQYLFYSNKLFNIENSKPYEERNIVRYRRLLDKDNQQLDDLVIITEACEVSNDQSQQEFLKCFYEKEYNKEKIYLGIGRWASSTKY